MRKEDLKDGMIIEVECSNLQTVRLIKLGCRAVGFNISAILTSMTDDLSWGDWDCRIIKVFKNISMTCLEDINNDKCLELIWKRGREIDWSKVPKWTKVQVKDFDEEDWENNYLIEFKKDKTGKDIFTTTNCDKFTYADYGDACDWWQCRIHESVEIKEEWYK